MQDGTDKRNDGQRPQEEAYPRLLGALRGLMSDRTDTDTLDALEVPYEIIDGGGVKFAPASEWHAETIAEIAERTGKSVAYLLGEDEEPKPSNAFDHKMEVYDKAQRAIAKLNAVAFALAFADWDSAPDSSVMDGAYYIVDECARDLETFVNEATGADKATA